MEVKVVKFPVLGIFLKVRLVNRENMQEKFGGSVRRRALILDVYQLAANEVHLEAGVDDWFALINSPQHPLLLSPEAVRAMLRPPKPFGNPDAGDLIIGKRMNQNALLAADCMLVGIVPGGKGEVHVLVSMPPMAAEKIVHAPRNHIQVEAAVNFPIGATVLDINKLIIK